MPSIWTDALSHAAKSDPTPSTEEKPSLFEEYVGDPVGFCRDILRYPGVGGSRPILLWGAQAAIARDVATKRRTTARSGHKVGKTVLVAALALWWTMTRPRGRAVLTSAGASNVKDQIWSELRAVFNASGGNERFRPSQPIPLDPATGLKFDDMRFIYGRTTSAHDAEKMSGYSGDQILFCIDEASGFPDALFEAVQGNMAGGGAVLATGNPTQLGGWFFESFNEKRRLWACHHIDSRTTPNATGVGDPIPGLATAQYVREMIDEYGQGDEARAERHPVFAVRVAGEFPTMGSRQVVPMQLIERSVLAWPNAKPLPEVLELGVDVALFGEDDTVIKPRRGNYAYASVVVHGFDPVEVAGKITEVIDDLGVEGQTMPIVKIDDGGGYGAGPIAILRRTETCVVVPVNAGSASDVEREDGGLAYANLRAELWFGVTKWLEGGGCMPNEPELEAELRAPVYDFTPKMAKRVESKADIKRRVGRSPDRADALALAVYTPGWAYAQAAVSRPDVATASRGQPAGLSIRGRGGGVW